MDNSLTILTPNAVFSAIVAHGQPENLCCVSQKSTLRLSALQFLCCGADSPVDNLDPQPESAAAVYFGDSYQMIEPFANRGWRTIWYNLAGSFPPTTQPLHDAELFTLNNLDKIPVLLRKPSLHTCQAWLDVW